MKKPILLLAILVVCAGTAVADSVALVKNASIVIFPNDGSGDNAAFSFGGPGTFIAGGGGTQCSWCFINLFSPGQTMHGSMDFFPSVFGTYQIAGQTVVFDPFGGGGSLGSGTVIVGNFTFPSGPNLGFFRIVLPASVSGFHGVTDQGVPFQLIVPNGKIVLTFRLDRSSGAPMYFFDQGRFFTAPEPGTMGLFATGMVGILGLFRKRIAGALQSSAPKSSSLGPAMNFPTR